MRGFRFELSCPDCGGEVDYRCAARISPTRSAGECWCASCLIVWRVDVELLVASCVVLSDDPRARAGEAIGNESLAVFA